MRNLRLVAVLAATRLAVPAFAQEAEQTESPKPLESAPAIITPSLSGIPKIFLPDIGIAGDAVFERESLPRNDPRHDPALQQPRIRDGQFVAFSPIDPYTNAQFTIDLPENGPAAVEEAWLYFTKLPGGAAVRLGRYLPQFGLLDLANTFQLPMLDRPSAIADYIGSDGLDATGIDVNFYVPNPWDLDLKLDLNAVRGDVLGSAAPNGDLAYLGTLDYSRDVFATGSLESGVSVAQGPSPYGRSEILCDPYLRIVYAPSQRRVWTWSAEGMLAERDGLGGRNFRRGLYSFLDYNFALRYHAGFLVDVVQVPGSLPTDYPGSFPDAFASAPQSGTVLNLAPNFTWFISDNTRLRAQYTHTTPLGSERPNETVALQATFSLGNLKQLQ